MAQGTNFPLIFLSLQKSANGQTVPGIYLRWFIKPFLGLPGIHPLHSGGHAGHPIEDCGFRLFYTKGDGEPPQLSPLDLKGLIPDEQQVKMLDLVTRPGWKAVSKQDGNHAQIEVNLQKKFKDQLCYLRFNYGLCAKQRMTLRYVIHDKKSGTDKTHSVDMHFDVLSKTLKKGEQESVTFAIHVDHDDESISAFSLISNCAIVLGEIEYALRKDLPFYIWTPDGGAGIWSEVPASRQLLQSLNSQLIQPGPYQEVVRVMTEFYKRYYGIDPHQSHGDQMVSFEHPDLRAAGLDPPPVREYSSDQYRELCEGGYEPGPGEGNRFYMPPQDAAALAAADPAIAYLLGLFRVLSAGNEVRRSCCFKVQGTWPEGRRYCIYSLYDPSTQLVQPQMAPVQARPRKSYRVLRDYLTFRTHHRINVADVCWREIQAGTANQKVWLGPVAYVILAESKEQQSITCKSPFYVPQDWEAVGQPKEIHYTDWMDFYRKTDVHKVLKGTYEYHVGGFDIFGQLSVFQTDKADIELAKLTPGEIQRPEITLSDLPSYETPGLYDHMDIPLEVEKAASGYKLRHYGHDYLSLDYSCLWPLDARYVWDKNRATRQPSIDHFRLLYMADVPLSSDVHFDELKFNGGQIKLELPEVAPATEFNNKVNASLFNMLKKIGAVGAAEDLLPQMVAASLKGGRLIYQQAWDIADVTVSSQHQKLELQLVPASDDARVALEAPNSLTGYQSARYQIISDQKLKGQLVWNHEAQYGGSRIGWKYLTAPGVKITSEPTRIADVSLISQSVMPTQPINLPPEIANIKGIEVSRSIPDQVPPPNTQYGFTIRLDKNHELAKFDRFCIVPVDPASNLEPGEYDKGSPPPGTDAEVPESVNKLFSEDLVLSFYASRAAEDPNYPEMVIYRGDALPFKSRDPAQSEELLLFPSKAHKNWHVIVPTIIEKMKVPLEEVVERGFNEDNYLTASIVMGLEAKVSGLDDEVCDNIQSSFASYKVSLVRYLPPPEIQIASAPPPSFGRASSPPDYNGVSLIQVHSIYDDMDLGSELRSDQHYRLYALPADRIVTGGMGIHYAVDGNSGNIYRRNMVALKSTLESYDPTDPLENDDLQQFFTEFAQQINGSYLDKTQFLDLPVALPGESRTVFLYAIKAYDPIAKKESRKFTCLSRPVYVEDTTRPAIPIVQYADLVLAEEQSSGTNTNKSYALNIEIQLRRRLTGDAVFGFASAADLVPELLDAHFTQILGQHRLYLTTGYDQEVLVCPDDSDFAPVNNSNDRLGDPNIVAGFNANHLQIRLEPSALDIQPLDDDPESILLTTKVRFHPTVDLQKLPARLFMCLRGINYLGQLSSFNFSPIVYREIG